MPHDLYDWIGRIKAVERQCSAAQFAVDWLRTMADNDASVLKGKLKMRDLRDLARHLDGTFLVRMFAEFEAGLRSYWSTLRDTHPPAQDLLDAIGARRRIAATPRQAPMRFASSAIASCMSVTRQCRRFL